MAKLKTPRRKNTETLIAHPPSPHEADVRIHHEPELQGGFKVLRDKGLRITNYREDIPK